MQQHPSEYCQTQRSPMANGERKSIALVVEALRARLTVWPLSGSLVVAPEPAEPIHGLENRSASQQIWEPDQSRQRLSEGLRWRFHSNCPSPQFITFGERCLHNVETRQFGFTRGEMKTGSRAGLDS